MAEVTYLVGRRLGPGAPSAFLSGLRVLEVEAPTRQDWIRIGDLVHRYGDLPLGSTDASVIALAERLGTDLLVTLDRRHFGAIPSASGGPFHLLPE